MDGQLKNRGSSTQRSRAEDWTLTQDTAQQGNNEERYGHILRIGNGDTLTYYKAMRRMQESGLDSAMVSQGALTKRWILKLLMTMKHIIQNLKDRIFTIYRIVTAYMKDHFGNGEMGKKKA
jgi:tRNA-dihydrouridine synthase